MNQHDLFPKAKQSDAAAPPTTPLVLTVEAAAERLGVGRTLMYALVKSGAVESVCIGRLRRIPADALDTFLSSLRAANSDEAA
jgi:excisionase family DNA binding protein